MFKISSFNCVPQNSCIIFVFTCSVVLAISFGNSMWPSFSCTLPRTNLVFARVEVDVLLCTSASSTPERGRYGIEGNPSCWNRWKWFCTSWDSSSTLSVEVSCSRTFLGSQKSPRRGPSPPRGAAYEFGRVWQWIAFSPLQFCYLTNL